MQVDVVHLKKYFGSTRAVDDISFSFGSGRIFGFVGPNGAGKTTAIRIMATLLDPLEGDVLVDGISVVEEPEKARHLLGYMPDSLPTHSDMTVHDYLDFFARAFGINSKRRHSVVEEVEQFANLMQIREKFLKALSKGMKQRVSLARSLVHNPSVLIMDEPASGLDPRARVELRELLKILADQGKAILISSHILTELAEICHGAVIIEQGKILQAGSIDELNELMQQRRIITVRPIAKLDEMYKELLQTPHVEQVSYAGAALEIETLGGEEISSDILAQLVKKGYRIAEFRQEQADLEDIFMNLTKGEVQ